MQTEDLPAACLAQDLAPLGMGIDQHGRLFKGGGKVFRAIIPKHAEFYSSLLRHPVIQSLMESETLVRTGESDLRIDGYGLILEHPLVHRVTYPFEWTASMFLDAAKIVLDFNLALMSAGYCTQDGHPWNILFDGVKPLFVDFTSIVPLPDSGRWPAVDEFEQYFLTSLSLMARGHHGSARALLRDIFTPPDPELARSAATKRSMHGNRVVRELRALIKPGLELFGMRTNELKKRLGKKFGGQASGTLSYVKQLRDSLETMKVAPSTGEWSKYYDGTRNPLPIFDGRLKTLVGLKESTPKHRAITAFLQRTRPKSLLDIGCNRGVFSQIASLFGIPSVGIDLDESALDQMYLDSRALKSSALPLYVNGVAPSEAIGFQEIPFPSAASRLRSECVLCLALVHHLAFRRTHMSLDHIVRNLSNYSEKTLVVEFVPPEDPYLQEAYPPKEEYTEANWISCLHRHFQSVERVESFPAPRLLFFCSK
jgi:hypothetical protein